MASGRGPAAGRGPGRGAVNPNEDSFCGPLPPRSPLVGDALSSDGMLHMMYIASGKEPQPALRFLPA